MVQVIQTGKSRAGKLSETLGNALGQGLGEFVGQYHTNKALDSVLNDESLKKAKPSERFERLQAALRPYGERGEKVLMSRLQQEQMAQQEAQQEQFSKTMGNPELANLPLNAQLEYLKAKKPSGSPANQAVPPEVTKAIGQVISKANGMTADQLQLAMDENNIPPVYSKPYVENKRREENKTQASKPIDPGQLQKIKDVRAQPGFNDEDELGQYRAFVDAGVSKENAEAESKLRGQQLTRKGTEVQKSFDAQKDFINETTDKYKAFETETKPRLLQMQNLDDQKLIGPTSAAFLDLMGIPLGALDDPSSELFQKLSLDMLKGLPETFGNRILKVEVDNFLQTIPQLINSPDGRRMIASNMLKLGEMKEIYYNEMRKEQRDALDNNKPLPVDFQQRVFDQVRPQIDRINNEFVKLAEIKHVPPNQVPFFDPNGQVKFVPKEHAEWAQQNGGRRIW